MAAPLPNPVGTRRLAEVASDRLAPGKAQRRTSVRWRGSRTRASDDGLHHRGGEGTESAARVFAAPPRPFACQP